MKRILHFALALCMTLSLLTAGVGAKAAEPELAERTYAILSESSVSVTVKTPCAAKVLFAVYDADRRLLGVSVCNETAADKDVTISVACEPDNAAHGKVFFLDDNWRPAAKALDVSIPVITMNEAFGLPKDMRFIENPQTEAELAGNVLWCFAHGEYEIGMNISSHIQGMPKRVDMYAGIHTIAGPLPELAGMYGNQSMTFCCGGDGDKKLVLRLGDSADFSVLEPAACYERQKQAYFKALEIHDRLHESGKITDGMTQREIAQVYYDYMVAQRETMTQAHGPSATIAQAIIEDSAYGALCYKSASCVGRAAALNMLLHTEGIACCEVCGQVVTQDGGGGGHGVSYMILDGEVYMGDWGNTKGIERPEVFYPNFHVDPASLAAAERVINGDFSGMIAGSPMEVRVTGDRKLSVTLPDFRGFKNTDMRSISFSFFAEKRRGTKQGGGDDMTIDGNTLTIDYSDVPSLSNDELWNNVLSTGEFVLRVRGDTWFASGITN